MAVASSESFSEDKRIHLHVRRQDNYCYCWLFSGISKSPGLFGKETRRLYWSMYVCAAMQHALLTFALDACLHADLTVMSLSG